MGRGAASWNSSVQYRFTIQVTGYFSHLGWAEPGHGAQASSVHYDGVLARLGLEDVPNEVLDCGLVTHEPELSLKMTQLL